MRGVGGRETRHRRCLAKLREVRSFRIGNEFPSRLETTTAPPPNTNNKRTQIPKQASTTTASSSRSRASKSTSRALAMRGSSAVSGTRSGASANSRGKRRRAEGGDPHEPQAVVSQASPSGAGSRKRRLPAWASAASSGREGDVSL